MTKKLIIDNKNIEIFYSNLNLKKLPVVILNTYGNEGESIFNECINLRCKDFIFIAISNLNWNDDMTPWFAQKLNKKDVDFLGKADDYIKLLTNKIIPESTEYIKNDLKIEIEYFAIAGYSLGGLFSIYSAYKTKLFTRIASASGSFWFPKFVEFAKENNISSNVKKIYFSLGNKESKVRNKILSTVEANTIELEKIYKCKGIKTIYEVNEGNHFEDAILRMSKGIKWILE